MLAIPIMKADPAADIAHLGIYLRGQNCYAETQVNQDLQKLEAMRREAVSVAEPSELGQSQLLRYCAQLKSISPRLSSMQADIKISLGWFDAFTQKKVTSPSFALDLACCLWNVGAHESLLGGRIDRSTDEGIRAANKHFQQAAGYFQYIQDQLLPALPASVASPCLSADSLTLCKQLMLSQAQLCFYEKAVKDKKKDSMKSVVVAKLAAQASIFYSSSSTTSRVGALSTILDISWFAVSDFQSKCFKGASEYWQALASKESALQRGSGYGEEIVRYNRAETHVRQAIDVGRKYNLPSTVTGGAEALLQAIIANRQSAQHDINTVYLESLPAESTVLDVQPVAMVKPSSLPELSTFLPETDQIFRYVLPRNIIESNKNFYDEVMTYYQRTQAEADNCTNIGRASLSSMGLPGSLEVVKHDQPLPETLWQKVQKAKDMGGSDRLTALLVDLKAASSRAWTAMTEIDDCLAREDRTNSDFTRRYPAFAGLASDPHTSIEIRNNNAKLREAYRSAQVNDEKLEADFKSAQSAEQLRLLTKTRDELQMLLRSAALEGPQSVNLLDFDEPSAQGGLIAPEAGRLNSKLHDLAGLFEERTRLVEQMKVITTVDLLDYVLKALETNGDIFAMHVQYSNESKDLMKKINDGFTQQNQMMDEIVRLNEAFVRSKQNDSAAMARNRTIQAIEVSATKFFALQSQLSAGLTFYSNLRSKVTTLQQNCDDLAYTQQWQRQEFEQGQVATQTQQAVQQAAQQQQQQDHALALRLQQEMNISPPAQSNIVYAAPAAAPAPTSPFVSSYSAVQYPAPAANPAPQIFAPHAAPSVAPASSNPYAFAPTVALAPAQPQAPAPAPSYSYSAYPGMAALPPAPQPAYNPSVSAYNPAASPYNPAASQQSVPVQHQHQPPQPAYAAYNSSNGKTPEQKVSSLVEMGFSVESARNALNANGGDEEAALNSLLSSAAGAPAPAPTAPATQKKGWGIWGKN